MRNRQEEIRSKGFDLTSGRRISYEGPTKISEYGSIKVNNVKILDDAVLNLGAIPKAHRQFGSKGFILRAIGERNLPLMREISNYFYNTSGIYSRVCDYFAYLYRYDWYIVPEVFDESAKTIEKALTDFDKIMSYLDNSHIKKLCGDIALEVIKNGAYYAYLVPSSKGLILQQLPVNYCRSRYFVGDMPVVEFDMRFFDENFRDPNLRMRVLKMFPKEIRHGYMLYKTGKIKDDSEWKIGVRNSWYPLDPASAIKFCLYAQIKFASFVRFYANKRVLCGIYYYNIYKACSQRFKA